jgi:hypothetical protein
MISKVKNKGNNMCTASDSFPDSKKNIDRLIKNVDRFSIDSQQTIFS